MQTTKELVYLTLSNDHKPNQLDIWDNSQYEPLLFISQCCQSLIEISELNCFCSECGKDIDLKTIDLAIAAEFSN